MPEWTNRQDPPVLTEYVGWNLHQRTRRPLFTTPPPIAPTFIRCNLINCELPPGSTVMNCNTAVKRFGEVVGQYAVQVDGVTVETQDMISDFVDGRFNPRTLAFEPKAIPDELPRNHDTAGQPRPRVVPVNIEPTSRAELDLVKSLDDLTAKMAARRDAARHEPELAKKFLIRDPLMERVRGFMRENERLQAQIRGGA